ncbi:hypothetical protein PBRA_006548 [Plasmodiophora brassicae]|nr:hypothetical protein PBRA_006548 [Plasmodiophora brassicae]
MTVRARPTIEALLFGPRPVPAEMARRRASVDTGRAPARNLFGMWDGVICRNLMQIFGGTVFIQLGVVFGVAGIGPGCALVLAGTCITLITALSLSAIATNGVPHAGGIYYLISRSLGPKFGAAIGVLLVVSAATDVAIFVVAFAESFISQMQSEYDPAWHLTSSGWDVQLIGALAFLVLLGLASIGVNLIVKSSTAFLALFAVGIGSVFVGAFWGPTKPMVGFAGPSWALLRQNFYPSYIDAATFMSMFSLFFPALTGFTGAATIYVDLRDPERAFPKGTIVSIVISSSVYIAAGVILGASCNRDTPAGYGLVRQRLIMVDVSIWGPLVYVGIYSSALSSALTLILVGPRVIQAIVADRLFPWLDALMHKPLPIFTSRQPVAEEGDHVRVRCLTLFAVIAFLPILLGSLNSTARLSTGSNLLSFMMINYAVFATSVSDSPGWRPSFRRHNQWVALAGVVLCAIASVIVNPIVTVLAMCVGGLIYKYAARSKRLTNRDWGSVSDVVSIAAAVRSLKRLRRVAETPKTYRPNFLVFCGAPDARPDLVRVADHLRMGGGLLTYANVIVTDTTTSDRGAFFTRLSDLSQHSEHRADLAEWIASLGVRGFTQVMLAPSLPGGVTSLVMSSGITTHLSANVAVFGFPTSWFGGNGHSSDRARQYVLLLQSAFALELGVVIIRHPELLRLDDDVEGRLPFVDVWWIYDDGGLTILMAYLLTKSPEFLQAKASLRIMLVDVSRTGRDAARMVGLLNKLRIRAELVAIPVELDGQRQYQPRPGGIQRFARMSAGQPLDNRTLKILCFAEMIRAYSSGSLAALVTIPVPNLAYAPARYLAWIDALSGVPAPVFLVRGNQKNVLAMEL